MPQIPIVHSPPHSPDQPRSVCVVFLTTIRSDSRGSNSWVVVGRCGRLILTMTGTGIILILGGSDGVPVFYEKGLRRYDRRNGKRPS